MTKTLEFNDIEPRNKGKVMLPQKQLLASFNGSFISVVSEQEAVQKALEKGINRFSLAEQFTIHHDGRPFKSDAERLPGILLVTSSQPVSRDEVIADLQEQYASEMDRYRRCHNADIGKFNGDLYNATDCASSDTMNAAFAARALEEVIKTYQNYPEDSLFIPEVGGRPGEYEQLTSDMRVYNEAGDIVFGMPAALNPACCP